MCNPNLTKFVSTKLAFTLLQLWHGNCITKECLKKELKRFKEREHTLLCYKVCSLFKDCLKKEQEIRQVLEEVR